MLRVLIDRIELLLGATLRASTGISGCGEFSVSAYTLAYAGDALAQVSRTSKSLQTAIVETRE